MSRRRDEEHEADSTAERRKHNKDVKGTVSAREELQGQFREAQSKHGKRLRKKQKDETICAVT
jgi:hypothetical protein